MDIDSTRLVSFFHRAGNVEECRVVLPLRIEWQEGGWVLVAWDPSRQAERTFALERCRTPPSAGWGWQEGRTPPMLCVRR